MWIGIWFQILGPQTEKARFANWDRVLMTTAAFVAQERSWRHSTTKITHTERTHRFSRRSAGKPESVAPTLLSICTGQYSCHNITMSNSSFTLQQ